jgi:hypothetical protein
MSYVISLFWGLYVYSVTVYVMLVTVLFGLLVVAVFNVLAGVGVTLFGGPPSQSFDAGVFVMSALLLPRM